MIVLRKVVGPGEKIYDGLALAEDHPPVGPGLYSQGKVKDGICHRMTPPSRPVYMGEYWLVVSDANQQFLSNDTGITVGVAGTPNYVFAPTRFGADAKGFVHQGATEVRFHVYLQKPEPNPRAGTWVVLGSDGSRELVCDQWSRPPATSRAEQYADLLARSLTAEVDADIRMRLGEQGFVL